MFNEDEEKELRLKCFETHQSVASLQVIYVNIEGDRKKRVEEELYREEMKIPGY